MKKIEAQINAKLNDLADLEGAQELIDANLDRVAGGVAAFQQHESQEYCPDCW